MGFSPADSEALLSPAKGLSVGNQCVVRILIFHCIFIEKSCKVSKLLQLIMKVQHIVYRKFDKIFISETIK